MSDNRTNDGGLFEQYPHGERFRLEKDGTAAETVLLPVHIQNYDWALLTGIGKPAELQSMLEREDLDLCTMQLDSPLNVGIFAINYKESDVGPFNEYYLVVSAKDRSIEGRPIASERTLGFYVWDIELDSDLAIRFGRQVWGHPKTYALGKVGFYKRAFGFDFTETSGKPIFSGSCGDCDGLPFAFVRFPPFFFITPYEIRRSWAKAINEGESAGRPYDSGLDRFEWNPYSRTGAKLTRVEFKPLYWTLGKNVRAVGFR
jgi:Acetoacetate decarboxylase (ADC)